MPRLRKHTSNGFKTDHRNKKALRSSSYQPSCAAHQAWQCSLLTHDQRTLNLACFPSLQQRPPAQEHRQSDLGPNKEATLQQCYRTVSSYSIKPKPRCLPDCASRGMTTFTSSPNGTNADASVFSSTCASKPPGRNVAGQQMSHFVQANSSYYPAGTRVLSNGRAIIPIYSRVFLLYETVSMIVSEFVRHDLKLGAIREVPVGES